MQQETESLRAEYDQKQNEIKEKAKLFIQRQKAQIVGKHSTEQSIQSSHEAKMSEILKEEESKRSQQLE